MGRLEYLTKLRAKLEKGGLPKDELEDVLRYYEEIFFDAGADREEETVQSLGEPEALARSILLENGINADGEVVFQMEEAVRRDGENSDTNGFFADDDSFRKGSDRQNNGQEYRNDLLKKVVLLVVTFPIWIVIASVVGSVAIAILAVAFALVVAGIAAGVGITVGGIAALFTIPPVGLCLLGGGLLLIGICGLIIVPLVKLVFRMGVSLINGIIAAIRRVFGIGGDRVNG